jgi:hypothetical protein
MANIVNLGDKLGRQAESSARSDSAVRSDRQNDTDHGRDGGKVRRHRR